MPSDEPAKEPKKAPAKEPPKGLPKEQAAAGPIEAKKPHKAPKPEAGPEAPAGLASTAAIFTLDTAWLGLLVGMAFLAPAAQPSGASLESALTMKLAVARLSMLTQIEVALGILSGLGQLYARASRPVWIVFGCLLVTLLVEMGWVQPMLVSDVQRMLDDPSATPSAAALVHTILDAARALGLIVLAALLYRRIVECATT